MIGPVQLIRLLRINGILLRHGLTRPVVGESSKILRVLSYLNPWSFQHAHETRGEAVRIAFEKLGPIFVKFGQLLSTRRDLFSDNISNELAKLQDQVPPFPGKIAKNRIEKAFQKTINEMFDDFDETPLASASIAQVHAATLKTGESVIVKVLRPNIDKTIHHDIALMYAAAKMARRFWHKGRRLKPVELVSEFEHTIMDELDLTREAANASQLRRNFKHSQKMYVPKIYWSFVAEDVMVMERIHGVRISDIDVLKAANTDLKKLAEYGVEIFFTQVLRDSFFHADMHPGNLFVDIKDPANPKYLGVDFGIMGTLSPEDQHYLASNLLAFFHRDYRKVAVLHIQSGWVPPNTRIDQFESSIRAVCEPIFEKPLKDISFGNLLLQLFRTAERFNMDLQPQLMLLKKTLLSIEGLGRQLYPELDLWRTAKPFLEKWVKKEEGLVQALKNTLNNLPQITEKLSKTPGVLYDVLNDVRQKQREMPKLMAKTPNRKRSFLLGAGLAFGAATIVSFSMLYPFISDWTWISGGLTVVFLMTSWAMPSSKAV